MASHKESKRKISAEWEAKIVDPRKMSEEWEAKLADRTEAEATPTMDAQSRFLQRLAMEKRELEKDCHCLGCDKCKGKVRGCNCQDDIAALREARGIVLPEVEVHNRVAETFPEEGIPF